MWFDAYIMAILVWLSVMFLTFIDEETLCCLNSKGRTAFASVREVERRWLIEGREEQVWKFAIKEGYEVAWYRFRRKQSLLAVHCLS